MLKSVNELQENSIHKKIKEMDINEPTNTNLQLSGSLQLAEVEWNLQNGVHDEKIKTLTVKRKEFKKRNKLIEHLLKAKIFKSADMKLKLMKELTLHLKSQPTNTKFNQIQDKVEKVDDKIYTEIVKSTNNTILAEKIQQEIEIKLTKKFKPNKPKIEIESNPKYKERNEKLDITTVINEINYTNQDNLENLLKSAIELQLNGLNDEKLSTEVISNETKPEKYERLFVNGIGQENFEKLPIETEIYAKKKLNGEILETYGDLQVVPNHINEAEIYQNGMDMDMDMEDNEVDKDNAENEEVEKRSVELTAHEQQLDEINRASGKVFSQHVPCYKIYKLLSYFVVPIPVCRECAVSRRNNTLINAQRHDVYCRFFEFRRLQYISNGQLIVSGFPNPYKDPKQDDINIWQPDNETDPTAGFMDIQVCRLILLHVGDQFCYLWRQEVEALTLHENPYNVIAWKKPVQGIREICDVCDTTLFNYHWTCDKCGFSVCLDCYKDRKAQRKCGKVVAISAMSERGRDDFYWFLCVSHEGCPVIKHELQGLMLTQIIPGDSLNVLGRKLHELRALWQVPQSCNCMLSKMKFSQNNRLGKVIKELIDESELKQRTAASSLATEETRRMQTTLEEIHSEKIKLAKRYGIKNYVPGREYNPSCLEKDAITTAFDKFKHINMYREGLAGLRRFIPPRTMTLSDSLRNKNVPHEWLCEGKLLRLTNPMNPDNRFLFQEVWKCGQPVMISQVERSLNLNLWRPEAFCQDFGDKPNDLINCLNGNLVPNQPMRHFWEGFQSMQKRLLDVNGKPMLLKLKDWPPGDDFAEIMPNRYSDLMQGLPMPEYTLRTGNLNLASCLPKMFVPPDLGPKMYNAYGSAQHPDKGTTNLHLDISDAVNIMVYVGIPTDFDCEAQLNDTHKAIAIGGCELLTRSRAQLTNVLPGALWHIFPARDADKIRDLLNRVTLEKGFRLEPDHDPIHDQNWYLDDKLRARLFREYGVEGYPIVQCLGDAVFIPAGAPHQVQNLHNCIKVAEDFVSPENITHCYHLTYEFRRLSHSHTNHEDKLQIKNIIYHAIKDCCNILTRAFDDRLEHILKQKFKQNEDFADAMRKKYNLDESLFKNADDIYMHLYKVNKAQKDAEEAELDRKEQEENHAKAKAELLKNIKIIEESPDDEMASNFKVVHEVEKSAIEKTENEKVLPTEYFATAN